MLGGGGGGWGLSPNFARKQRGFARKRPLENPRGLQTPPPPPPGSYAYVYYVFISIFGGGFPFPFLQTPEMYEAVVDK